MRFTEVLLCCIEQPSVLISLFTVLENVRHYFFTELYYRAVLQDTWKVFNTDIKNHTSVIDFKVFCLMRPEITNDAG